jgi:hypothetical protein
MEPRVTWYLVRKTQYISMEVRGKTKYISMEVRGPAEWKGYPLTTSLCNFAAADLVA